MSAVFTRDASWYSRPNVRHVKQLHRESERYRGFAACSSRIILDTDTPMDSADFDALLCRRCFRTPLAAEVDASQEPAVPSGEPGDAT